MAPRSSWKGFLRLSLVSVPVKAFTANNTGEEVRLNQLHKECHARVKYQKVCPEHGVLKSSDIVSGYEFAKDQYVVIDPQEIQKLRRESDKSVHIQGFVEADAIDPIYLAGKTYYLLPDGPAGGRPYELLRRGMDDAGVVAVAQVVLSGREQLVQVRTVEGLLVMQFLNYAKKVKGLDEFTSELSEQKTEAAERKLTKTLIDASRIEDFDLASFEDPYVETMSKLIQMKVDGKEVVSVSEPEEPKIVNLMEALKKSVADAQLKMAPSTKKKKAARKAKRRKTGS